VIYKVRTTVRFNIDQSIEADSADAARAIANARLGSDTTERLLEPYQGLLYSADCTTQSEVI
jgi:hypothetical protein